MRERPPRDLSESFSADPPPPRAPMDERFVLSRRRRRSSKAPLVITLVAVGATVIAGVLVLPTFLRELNRPAPPPQPAPAGDPQDVVQAFRDKPLVAPELARELAPFFDKLGQAFAAGDGNRIVNLIHVRRLLDELVALKVFPEAAMRNRDQAERAFRLGIVLGLPKQDALFMWQQTDVKHVRILGRDDVLVIARHKDAQLGNLKMRWWLTRQDGTWKLFDFEDLHMGMRMSMLLAQMGQVGLRDVALAQAVNKVRDAAMAIVVNRDPVTAERLLDEVAHVQFPKALEGVREVVRASAHLHNGRHREALDAIERAHQHHPDMPVVDLFKGIVYNRLADGAKALRHVEIYRALLGDDEEVLFERGLALQHLRRFDEAAADYRRCLDVDPKHAEAFVGLVGSLGANGKRDDVAERFARLDSPHENFDTCALNCWQDRNPEMLEVLADAMRRIDPNYAAADYYQALARIRIKPDDAVRLFGNAVAKEKNQAKRDQYIAGFQTAMLDAGRGDDVYPLLPEPREAFRLLAGELMRSFRREQLGRLVEAHRRRVPDDPLLPFYQAEVHVYQGDYELADKTFTGAMTKPPEVALLDTFRPSRVQARYHSAGALSAYDDIGPPRDTFLQLAGLLYGDRDLAQLEKLTDRHAAKDADDPQIIRQRIRIAFARQNTETALKLFRAELARAPQRLEDMLFDLADDDHALAGYQAAPDARAAFKILAPDLLANRRLDDLRPLVAAHAKKHADDPLLPRYAGEVALDDREWDKASAQLAKALEQAADDNARRALRYRYVFARVKAGHGVATYQAAAPADRKATFDQIAPLLLGDKAHDELARLLDAHRPHAGGDDILDEYQVRLLIRRGQTVEGLALWHKAWSRQTEEMRRTFSFTVCDECTAQGKILEGYRAAPDRRQAFRCFVQPAPRPEILEPLLAEHAKAHGDDPWLDFGRSELDLAQGRATQAKDRLAGLLKKMPQADEWTVRDLYRRACIQSGQAVEAYRAEPPGGNPLWAVANACVQLKNGEQLAAVLAAHRATHPHDAATAVWDLEVLWLNGDYEVLVKRLDKERKGPTFTGINRGKVESFLVRGLIKLKRTDDAVREAEALTRRGADRLLLVLAHAAGGDVERTLAAFVAMREHRGMVGTCYAHPDLGPILRSEPFAPFRARFPEPAPPFDLDANCPE